MVQIKRKVTIKKKVEQEEIPIAEPIVTPNSDSDSAPAPTPEHGSSKSKWIIGVAVALGLCGAAYFLMSDGNSEKKPVEEQAEVIAEQPKEQEIPEVAEPAVVEEEPVVTEATSPKVATGNVSPSIEENAKRVIRGEFGNGQTRKDKLGDKYDEIQSRVNEMYRNGLV